MVKIRNRHIPITRINRLRSPEMIREVGKAVYVAADMLSTEAALSITNGAVSGKNHVASKLGEPPNADTHLLDRSIHTERVEGNPLSARSVADAPYAAALEGGSSRSAGVTSRSFAGKTTSYGPSKVKQGPVRVEFGDSQTAARPFMVPAARKVRPDAVQLVAEALKRVSRGGTL